MTIISGKSSAEKFLRNECKFSLDQLGIEEPDKDMFWLNQSIVNGKPAFEASLHSLTESLFCCTVGSNVYETHLHGRIKNAYDQGIKPSGIINTFSTTAVAAFLDGLNKLDREKLPEAITAISIMYADKYIDANMRGISRHFLDHLCKNVLVHADSELKGKISEAIQDKSFMVGQFIRDEWIESLKNAVSFNQSKSKQSESLAEKFSSPHKGFASKLNKEDSKAESYKRGM